MVIQMKVRLGYVALSKALDDITTSSTITYTNYINKNYNTSKLLEITKNNLDSLYEIIKYNVKNNFHFYRLTSKLVPLATHDKVNFDYITPLLDEYKKIGKLINDNNIRVDTHPDQYAVLNSMDSKIVKNTVEILEYHYKIMDAIGIKDKIIILHVGSSACGKKASITRFINNFNKLPDHIKKCIAVENDDKVYNIKDVLELCHKINVPMVLDYHHFICNNEKEDINDYLKEIIDTWDGKLPKMHFSSPKSKLKKEFRSHSDYINKECFIKFINILKKQDKDIDIMLEAKAKDDAVSRLARYLKYKTNYKFLDDTTFII
ncbi:uV damage endonuclease UvdE [Clostridium sp. CAG:594]|nr:uV damage endonuclease UvdE [Clostridium sp. CAG:594]